MNYILKSKKVDKSGKPSRFKQDGFLFYCDYLLKLYQFYHCLILSRFNMQEVNSFCHWGK